MNIHPDSKDSLSLNLLIGGNSPDAKSLAVLAALDISASIIASAPLPRSRWMDNKKLGKYDLNKYGAVRARDFPNAYELNSMARLASAEGAGVFNLPILRQL
jgi:hypothetical protein